MLTHLKKQDAVNISSYDVRTVHENIVLCCIVLLVRVKRPCNQVFGENLIAGLGEVYTVRHVVEHVYPHLNTSKMPFYVQYWVVLASYSILIGNLII